MPPSTNRIAKRRRWFRIVVRALFIIVALAAAAAIGIYFSPLSFRFLDRRIAAGLSRALNVQVSFDRATLHLSTRQIELKNVRLSLPTQSAESEVQLDALELTSRSPLIPLPAQWSFSRIRLSELSEIALQRTDDGWRVPPAIEQILSAIQAQPSSPSARAMPDLLQLSLVGLRIEDRRRASAMRTLRFHPIEATLQVQPDGDWSLNSKADLEGLENISPIRIFLDGEGDRPECRYYVRIASFDTKDFQSLGSPAAYECDTLSVEGKVLLPSASSGVLNFDVSVSASPSVLETYDTPRRFEIPELQWKAEGSFDRTLSEFHFTQTVLNSGPLEARAGLDLNLSPAPGRFDLRLDQLRIEESAFHSQLERLFPPDFPLQPRPAGQATVKGFVRGPLESSSLPDYDLTIECRQGKIFFQPLLAQLTDLDLHIRATPDLCKIESVRGKLGLGEWSGEGSLRGDPFSTSPLALDLSWAGDFRLEDLQPDWSAVPEFAFAKGSLSGHLITSGTLTQPFPSLHSGATSLGDLDLRGYLRLDNVEVQHPDLPAPLREMDGLLTVTPSHLEATHLTARFLSSAANLQINISGQRFFWIRPVASGRLQSAMSLKDLAPLFDYTPNAPRLPPELDGRFACDLNFKGPLQRPADFNVIGNIELSELSLPIESKNLSGNLRGGRASLQLAADSVHLSNGRFSLDDLSYTFDGYLTQKTAKLTFTSAGPLEPYARPLGRVFDQLKLAGNGATTATLTLAGSAYEVLVQKGNYQNYPLRLVSNVASGVLNPSIFSTLLNDPSTRLDGTMFVRDASFYFDLMPKPVTHITGPLTFDLDGIYASKVSSQWGSSKDVSVDGVVAWNHAGGPYVEFSLEGPDLALEEWFTTWGHRNKPLFQDVMEHATTQEDVSTTPALIIHCNVKGQKFRYQRFEGGPMEAHFEFLYYLQIPNEIYFADCKAEAYGGLFNASGYVIIPRVEANLWGVDATCSDVNTKSFFTAVFEEPSHMDGRLAGQVRLKGLGSDFNTFAGNGLFTISETRFIGSRIFRQLGALTRIPIFEDISFTTISAPFNVENERIFTEQMRFGSPLLELIANGSIGFDRSLDLNLYLRFLSGILELPLIKEITQAIESITDKVFHFRLTGTLNDPKIVPAPLSVEKILPSEESLREMQRNITQSLRSLPTLPNRFNDWMLWRRTSHPSLATDKTSSPTLE